MYQMFVEGYPSFRGGVDRGPDSWAIALAAGIVSMAIAMAILVGSLI